MRRARAAGRRAALMGPFAAMPFASWMHLWMRTAEMAAASAQVIGQRMTRIAAAGHAPTAADRRELSRMVAEKASAGVEAWSAVGSQWLAEGWRAGQRLVDAQLRAAMSLWTPGAMRIAPAANIARAMFPPLLPPLSPRVAERLAAPAARLAHRVVTPYRSRARANAKRLSKR